MALQSKQERAEPLVCWEGFGFELISCIDTQLNFRFTLSAQIEDNALGLITDTSERQKLFSVFTA